MRHRKYLNRTFFQLKSIGLWAFVPFATFSVLFPALLLLSTKNAINPLESARNLSMILLPPMTVWLPVFVWREFIESDGNELLFLYGRRIKLWDGLRLWVLALINLALVQVFSLHFFPELALLSLWMLLTSLFYFALAYFISFTAKSTAITLMACLLYHFANLAFPAEHPTPLLFYSAGGYAFEEFWVTYLPMCVLSALFLALGVVMNRRMVKYR